MRPKRSLRKSRLVYVAAGAVMLAIPASAVALAAGQVDTQSALQIAINSRHLAYGGEERITGTASPADAGQRLALEFARAGSSSWRVLSATMVSRDGGFAFVAKLRQSGLVRLVGSGATTAQGTVPLLTGDSTITPSAAWTISVASEFAVPTRSIHVLTGQAVDVRGKLLPAVAGRRVRLVGRTGSGWHTVASAHTGPRGGFDLRFTPSGTGQQWLRVQFAGDRLNTRSWAHAGHLTVSDPTIPSVASWYDDGGSTACGFHAYYGVANRDLPCGTQVTFTYGGRTVTATVDDRGPFVAGRNWDLNQNTAAALGFGGVDTVWASM